MSAIVRKQSVKSCALVLLELGAAWPASLGAELSGVEEVVVVAQTSDENSEAYATRVRARVEALEHSGSIIELGVIAVSDYGTHAAQSVRRSNSSRLLSRLSKRGRLVLVDTTPGAGSSSTATPAAHVNSAPRRPAWQLVELLDTLTPKLIGTERTITLKLDGKGSSGVYPAVRPAEPPRPGLNGTDRSTHDSVFGAPDVTINVA